LTANTVAGPENKIEFDFGKNKMECVFSRGKEGKAQKFRKNISRFAF